MEKSPQLIKEETISFLEAEQPIWSDLRRRNERSGGLDAGLTAQYEDSNDRMDILLEYLFIAKVALDRLSEPVAA